MQKNKCTKTTKENITWAKQDFHTLTFPHLGPIFPSFHWP